MGFKHKIIYNHILTFLKQIQTNLIKYTIILI